MLFRVRGGVFDLLRGSAPVSLAFARFRRQLAAITGIALGPEKQYLAESRLAPVMRDHGVADMAELTRRIDQRDNDALIQEAMDAMTTNETSFFRDRAPFDEFRERILPELLIARAKERRLRIWCAACSTGQEAYSIGMTLEHEARSLRGWNVEILATDLSHSAIAAARKGVYSQFEVQRGLSTSQMLRYFHRHEEHWRVNEHLRARIGFRELNLLDDYSEFGAFDVIFCRNVLLYFEPDVKRDILSRLSGALAQDGRLVLGASETLGESTPMFMPASREGVWRRRAPERPRLQLA